MVQDGECKRNRRTKLKNQVEQPKKTVGCGSETGTRNGTQLNHGLKPAVAWWFNFDPYQIGNPTQVLTLLWFHL